MALYMTFAVKVEYQEREITDWASNYHSYERAPEGLHVILTRSDGRMRHLWAEKAQAFLDSLGAPNAFLPPEEMAKA